VCPLSLLPMLARGLRCALELCASSEILRFDQGDYLTNR
jgi:hypothetical protein